MCKNVKNTKLCIFLLPCAAKLSMWLVYSGIPIDFKSCPEKSQFQGLFSLLPWAYAFKLKRIGTLQPLHVTHKLKGRGRERAKGLELGLGLNLD